MMNDHLGQTPRLILGPLLFLIYIKVLRLARKSCDVFLIADDTNINRLSCGIPENNNDMDKVSHGLKANKLSLNFEKQYKLI